MNGESRTRIQFTPWGKFVMEHSVTVPLEWWRMIRMWIEGQMDADADWQFALTELATGCEALRDGRLQEIMCRENEA